MRSQTRPQRFKPTSPTAAVAYRKDIEARKGPIGADDGSWIVISTIVGHIAYAEGTERRRFLDDAARMAAELFTPEVLAFGCAFDPPRVNRESSIAVLRLLAERMEYAGSLNLADCLLVGLAGILPVDSVNSGRVLAQRARLSWKAGKPDLALARYQHLRRKAGKLRSYELVIRSWVGYIALAQLRGNFPDMRRWGRLIVEHGERCGYARLASVGHQGLTHAHAVAGEFQVAIPHAWQAYRAREGDKVGQSEMLTNLGQLFFEAGHPAVARNAFVRVLGHRPPVAICAPAIGGYALCSAALGDRRAVAWAAEAATTLSDQPGISYQAASTLIDCANALDAINDLPYASVLRARGSAIAQYGGFHELVHRAEARPPSPVQAKASELRGAQFAVAEAIGQLPTSALPDRLELVPA